MTTAVLPAAVLKSVRPGRYFSIVEHLSKKINFLARNLFFFSHDVKYPFEQLSKKISRQNFFLLHEDKYPFEHLSEKKSRLRNLFFNFSVFCNDTYPKGMLEMVILAPYSMSPNYTNILDYL